MKNSPNILFITTMYPTPLRPGTRVCHYFTRQWKAMGYNVVVIHYRSMFPAIYTMAAGLFPNLAKKYVGNHVEMDRNMEIVEHKEEEIPVYSIPIYKYIPHGKYSARSINKAVGQIEGILKDRDFKPDAVIGHFYNPTLEIVGRLKQLYPQAHTCVSLHELNPEVIKKCYPKNYEKILNGVDMIGFRSIPIKQRFKEMFGDHRKHFVCWSGTPVDYLRKPITAHREFKDGSLTKFLYVGQTIKRKYPKETLEGIHKASRDREFSLIYVGSKDLGYSDTVNYMTEHHLEKNVTFTGKIPRSQIMNYYDQSECFILISKDEVFGLVYLEAMARGCIVVASKGEGMEGIIEHGVNGFFCEAGNADELAGIIRHINTLSAKDKSRISEMAQVKAKELSDYNVAKYYIDAVLK